ncbi:MAG: D-glycero-beta-D-manno-heptose-7-phosphate kinase [Mariprofundales bacterium]
MIIVIGDIIVDDFLWGDVKRISPEAPVPVVDVSKHDRRLGGAANVVRNLNALSCNSAMLGVVGDDEAGSWVRKRLIELDADISGVAIKQNGRPTAVKTRLIARHQQMLRFDREWQQEITTSTQTYLLEQLRILLPQADAVVLSDYGKGVLSPDMLTRLMPMLENHLICVDPKPAHTQYYQYASIITPNIHEAAAMLGMYDENTDAAVEIMARKLHADLALKYVLITRAERGMSLFDGQKIQHIPTMAQDVFDVTGAGDTVIAVLTACLARGDDIFKAAYTANLAAGVVVKKVGTATASWQEITTHEHEQ